VKFSSFDAPLVAILPKPPFFRQALALIRYNPRILANVGCLVLLYNSCIATWSHQYLSGAFSLTPRCGGRKRPWHLPFLFGPDPTPAMDLHNRGVIQAYSMCSRRPLQRPIVPP